jgi:hypothetical protein
LSLDSIDFDRILQTLSVDSEDRQWDGLNNILPFFITFKTLLLELQREWFNSRQRYNFSRFYLDAVNACEIRWLLLKACLLLTPVHVK